MRKRFACGDFFNRRGRGAFRKERGEGNLQEEVAEEATLL
jgi:hypothetical protein